jgi:hypothetical protein
MSPSIDMGSYTEDSIMLISESVINTLPLAVFSKLPRIEKKVVQDFNHELFLYCQRKNINPMDYLFDEFGLVVCGIGIAATHYANYQEIYGKGKKKGIEKGNEAYEHAKEISAQNEESARIISEKEKQQGIQYEEKKT